MNVLNESPLIEEKREEGRELNECLPTGSIGRREREYLVFGLGDHATLLCDGAIMHAASRVGISGVLLTTAMHFSIPPL